jgi:hypothetical protein
MPDPAPNTQGVEEERTIWRITLAEYPKSEPIYTEDNEHAETYRTTTVPYDVVPYVPASRLVEAEAERDELAATNEGGFDEVVELREKLEAMTSARDLCKRQTAQAHERSDKRAEAWKAEMERANRAELSLKRLEEGLAEAEAKCQHWLDEDVKSQDEIERLEAHRDAFESALLPFIDAKPMPGSNDDCYRLEVSGDQLRTAKSATQHLPEGQEPTEEGQHG